MKTSLSFETDGDGRRGLRILWQDRSGAALVQFLIVLPAMIALILGMVNIFSVMAMRDTLCEATRVAGRYLQVEGPQFPTDDPALAYPVGWEEIAWQMIDQELASRTLAPMRLERGKDVVDIWPDDIRQSPRDTVELQDDPQIIKQALFYVRATKSITIPYGFWLRLPNPDNPDEELPPGQLKLTCRTGAFYEGPPIAPTRPPRRDPPPAGGCERPNRICPPRGGATTTDVPAEGTATVCPTCRPR